MNIEGIINGLIVTVVGWIIVFIGKKIFNDWFYIQILLPNKKGKDKKRDEIKVETKEDETKDENRKKDKKKSIIKIYRKFPWHHAYKYAEIIANKLKGETEKQKYFRRLPKNDAKDLYKPSIIIGIGRGGAVFGSIFSYYMKETPLLAIDRKYLYNDADERIGEDWYYPFDIPKELLSKVLLVAGEYHSGKTMQKIYERLKEIGADEIRPCVLYYQTGLPDQVGEPYYYGISGKRDCLMPWQQKEFLRTWKDGNDAKVRDYSLSSIQLDSLKDGFFLMRHAKTDANVEDIFIGSGSPQESINYEGIIESRNVAKFLKETAGRIDVIFSSPMMRCVQTAKEIQNEAGGEIVVDDRLIEVDFGNWEGVKRSDLSKTEYDKYTKDQNYSIPGSTSLFPACQARAKAFLDDLAQNEILQGKKILVITHKTIGRIMVQTIENKANRHFRSIPMENASLRKVVVDEGVMSIPYYIKVLDGEIVVRNESNNK